MAKKLKFLVIHCTATPEGRNVTVDDIVLWHRGAFKNPPDKNGVVLYTFLGKRYTIEQLRQQTLTLPSGRKVSADKTNGRGWSALGYTNMFLLDGTNVKISANNEDGYVDSWEITNGVVGINCNARHVTYAGGTERNNVNKAKDTRTPAQLAALEKFVKQFVGNHPGILIAGHDQFAAKACPSFNTIEWCRSIGIPERNIYNPLKK